MSDRQPDFIVRLCVVADLQTLLLIRVPRTDAESCSEAVVCAIHAAVESGIDLGSIEDAEVVEPGEKLWD